MPECDVLEALLERNGVVVLDGGFSGELEKVTGRPLDRELWTAAALIDSRNAVVEVHRRFCEAGANVATTATYQASFEGFAKKGLSEEQARVLFKKSVALAREAGAAVVAGSLGPYAAMLADGSEYQPAYVGEENIPMLKGWHQKRLDALVAGEPDWLAFETIPCASEGRAIAAALQEANYPPAWLTFCCKSGTELASGELLTEAVSHALQADQKYCIRAIGFNCVAPEHAASLICCVRKALDSLPKDRTLHIVAYPNAGKQWNSTSAQWVNGTGATVAAFQRQAAELYDLGARLIGGCCQVTPAMIAGIADSLKLSSNQARKNAC
ncbi:Homocysteine S-methyltransferase 1 [Diplonema papillatum]|nr:Homocysteine S-methyltransferase 1 [Diplonema papillatum]